MRQLSAGIRSNTYCNAQADAGLSRGWTMIAVGTAPALPAGPAATYLYARKSLHYLTFHTR